MNCRLFTGDDEVEVNRQPRSCREPGEATKMDLLHRNPKSVGRLESAGDGEISVMVAVGCKSCLMYVMISKQNPSCPKCGNADDTLLQVPTPLPSNKRQRLKVVLDTTSPSWSWSTAWSTLNFALEMGGGISSSEHKQIQVFLLSVKWKLKESAATTCCRKFGKKIFLPSGLDLSLNLSHSKADLPVQLDNCECDSDHPSGWHECILYNI